MCSWLAVGGAEYEGGPFAGRAENAAHSLKRNLRFLNGRRLAGLYLDEPVKMDDPYRLFRW